MTTIGAVAENKNIGAAFETKIGANAVRTSAVETEIVGTGFDRVPPVGGDSQPISHDSMAVVVACEGNLDAAATLTLTLEIEDAAPTTPGGSTAGAYAPVDSDHQPTATVVINGGAGGAFQSCHRMDLRLTSLRRFVRGNITPNFSAAGGAAATNFAQIAIVYVLGTRNVVLHGDGDWIPGYEV